MDHSAPIREYVSRQIMLVCSDASVRERTTTHLRECELEMFVAEDEQTALAQFGRQSFPVVICDRTLGSIDGTDLVRQIRCLSIEPVYILMMSGQSSPEEIERGYRAGVDHYMPRNMSTTLLRERIQTAFKAISLRRMTRIVGTQDVTTVDLASGAHTARHLIGRLSAEMDLARRIKATLQVAIVRITTADARVTDDLLAVLEAVQGSLRPRCDWVTWLHPVGNTHRLAVVMPNASHGGAEALEQHVRNAFVLDGSTSQLALSIGHFTFQPGEDAGTLTGLGLLARAEQHLRSLGSPDASKGLLSA